MKLKYIVVGQGLAGSILAWELMQREHNVLVLDNAKPKAASRVAAGLINPVTGQRLVKSVEADLCLPFAIDYYQKLENTFQQSFYHDLPMLRLFRTRGDVDRANNRANDPLYQAYFGEIFAPGQSGEPVNDSLGSIEQRQTGYLAITPLLSTLKRYFQKHHAYVSTHFEYSDLLIKEKFVQWKDYQAENIIFCDGANAINNPWFHWLPFQLSKGEIISVKGDSQMPEKIINDGQWLIPVESRMAKVGATFSWEWSDEKPEAFARKQLLDACARMVAGECTWSVVAHNAGVRPTTKDKKPFIGFHPNHNRMAIFNGFGAKGSMLIPYYASKLVAHLRLGEPLPTEVDISRFGSGKSMTTLAKLYLSETIKPGDVVIDATIGNGYDTEFLARCVGQEGKVIGLDIQDDAIAATEQKLKSVQLFSRVSLHKANHVNLAEYVDNAMRGQIAAIAFNLGYLPGKAKTVKTQSRTTINALEKAVELVKPGGIITVISYPGHQGGKIESDSIQNRFSESKGNNLIIKFVHSNNSRDKAPELMIIKKLSEVH